MVRSSSEFVSEDVLSIQRVDNETGIILEYQLVCLYEKAFQVLTVHLGPRVSMHIQKH
jgi:hypothetical protein